MQAKSSITKNSVRAQRAQKEQDLRDEAAKCLILSDDDKKFWIDHAASLPPRLLEEVTENIRRKNKIIDSYISTALADDPDHKYLSELKEKIIRIKKTVFNLDESVSKENADDLLNKALEKL